MLQLASDGGEGATKEVTVNNDKIFGLTIFPCHNGPGG